MAFQCAKIVQNAAFAPILRRSRISFVKAGWHSRARARKKERGITIRKTQPIA
jgi:hypothetical protein